MGDLLSTIGGVHYREGKIFCYLSTPTVLMISPRYSIYKGWYPPTVHMISPTCIMISPTVLSIPHGTQDNLHGTYDTPTILNTPTVLMISPTCIMISPHGTERPTVLKIPPICIMISPHGIEHPHGNTHTFTGCSYHFHLMLFLVYKQCVKEEISNL